MPCPPGYSPPPLLPATQATPGGTPVETQPPPVVDYDAYVEHTNLLTGETYFSPFAGWVSISGGGWARFGTLADPVTGGNSPSAEFQHNDLTDPNRGRPGYVQAEDGSWVPLSFYSGKPTPGNR